LLLWLLCPRRSKAGGDVGLRQLRERGAVLFQPAPLQQPECVAFGVRGVREAIGYRQMGSGPGRAPPLATTCCRAACKSLTSKAM
jgi:hypothetical protein